jgi:hypothetical protein
MKNTKRGLVALLALSAIGTGSASAAAVTEPAKWFTGASPGTELVGAKAINCSLHPGTIVRLAVEVGGPPTQVLEMDATGMECLSATIENKEVTGKTGKVAFGTGKIKFTGVTVTKPAGCQAEEAAGGAGHITTAQLNVHADFMHEAVGDPVKHAVQQFLPASGSSFVTFRLENTPGGTCPVSGVYSLKGTLYTNAAETNPTGTVKEIGTGVFKSTQLAATSPGIETTDGGGLFIGTKAANLTVLGAYNMGGTEFTVK